MIYAPGASPMHQSLAKWVEKGCRLGGGGRELDSLCAARVCQRSLTVSSLASGDVRRSRRDVKTGPADGFEASSCFWPPLGTCGPTHWPTDRCLWVGDAMWAVVYVRSAKSSVFGGFLSRGQE